MADDFERNVFVRRHVERFLAAENLPAIALDRLPKISTRKPSPTATPSASALAQRAQYRKQQAFLARKKAHKQQQREDQDVQQDT